MEPMVLGSPNSPHQPVRTLPGFLFGDVGRQNTSPAPSSPQQPAVKTIPPFLFGDRPLPSQQMSPGGDRLPMFPKSPVVRRADRSMEPFVPLRLPSPAREHRGGAPPVLGLDDFVASPLAARRQLNYSTQFEEPSTPYNTFNHGRAPRTPAFGKEVRDNRVNGYDHGDVPVTPVPRRLETSAAYSPMFPSSGTSFISEKPAASDNGPVWVTVFGFAPEKAGAILQYFIQLGNVQEHKRDDGESNWIHLKYPNLAAAQMAMGRNGSVVQGTMVGVKMCDRTVSEQFSKTLQNGRATEGKAGLNTSTMVNGVEYFANGVRNAATPLHLMGVTADDSANSSGFFTDLGAQKREKGLLQWAVDLVLGGFH